MKEVWPVRSGIGNTFHFYEHECFYAESTERASVIINKIIRAFVVYISYPIHVLKSMNWYLRIRAHNVRLIGSKGVVFHVVCAPQTKVKIGILVGAPQTQEQLQLIFYY